MGSAYRHAKICTLTQERSWYALARVQTPTDLSSPTAIRSAQLAACSGTTSTWTEYVWRSAKTERRRYNLTRAYGSADDQKSSAVNTCS